MAKADLIIELDGMGWRTVNPVPYLLKKGPHVTVPGGFWFDGGSIPRTFRAAVCPMDCLAIRGFLIHDWFYHLSREGKRLYTRKQVDKMMLHQHHLDDVPEVLSHSMYRAVRIGSSWSWMTEAEREERSRYEWDD